MRGIAVTQVLEGAIASVGCLIIGIATVYFVTSQEPIQDIINTESKEADLIRAIYIDEFARNFVKYGMKFILQEGMDKISAKGGLLSPQAYLYQNKEWINLTSSGLTTAIPLQSGGVPVDKAIPSSEVDKVLYYRWLNTTHPYNDILLSDLTDEDERKFMVEQSMDQAFSLTTYLSKFAKYTQMYPEITSSNQKITLDSDSVSASGDFKVVVRVGGNAGVNSTEKISSSIDTEILEKVEAAAQFSEDSYLDDVLSNDVDVCGIVTGSINSTDVAEAFGSSSHLPSTLDSPGGNSYYYTVEDVIVNFQSSGGDYCLHLDVIYDMDDGFLFRTHLNKCVSQGSC